MKLGRGRQIKGNADRFVKIPTTLWNARWERDVTGDERRKPFAPCTPPGAYWSSNITSFKKLLESQRRTRYIVTKQSIYLTAFTCSSQKKIVQLLDFLLKTLWKEFQKRTNHNQQRHNSIAWSSQIFLDHSLLNWTTKINCEFVKS